MTIERSASSSIEPAVHRPAGSTVAGRSAGDSRDPVGGFSALLQGLGEAAAPTTATDAPTPASLSATPTPSVTPGAPLAPATSLPPEPERRFASAQSSRPLSASLQGAQATTATPDAAAAACLSASTPQVNVPDAGLQAMLVPFHPGQMTVRANSLSTPVAPARVAATKTSGDPLAQTVAGQNAAQDAAAQALLAQFLGMAGGLAAPDVPAAGEATPSTDVPARWPTAAGAAAPAALAAASTAALTLTLAASAAAAPGPGAGWPAGAAHGVATRWMASGHVQGQVPWQSTVATQAAPSQLAGGSCSAVDTGKDATTAAGASLADAAVLPNPVAALALPDKAVRARRDNAVAVDPSGLNLPALSGSTAPAVDMTLGSVNASAAPNTHAALERAVADQVKYWISNDIQGAELKFDGLGPDPVQVSISMSGNEAQVVFRSDQAQTRELLGNAMTQLDQMLRAEGLTLTAAWVGTSGQQGEFGSQAQQGRSAQHGVSPGTQSESAASVIAPPRRVATERAVDLFV